jgi:hypothetical protein
MSRAMLVAAGAALLAGADCDTETSVTPPYGLPPHQLTPDAGTDTPDATQAGQAADANAADESSQGEDAVDGVDR